MKKPILWMTNSFVATIALSFSLLTHGLLWAQSKPEPSAIISIAPVDNQLKDIEYLANAMSESIGQMSGIIRFQAEGFMPGVDFSRPAGAFLYFTEGKDEPDALGFFPVKSLDDILDKISEFAELEEDGDTVTILPDNGQELTLVSKDGYAFVSDKAKMLDNLPADPESLLKNQTETYNFSAQIFPQRIPEDLRDKAIEMIRAGYEANLSQMDELQAELQQAQFDTQMKQLEMMINDFESMVIGLHIDESNERVYADINMKGVSGSEMQKRLMASKISTPSKFAGFLMEKAALTFHNCSGIAKEDAAIYMESMDNLRDTMLEEMAEKGEDSEVLSKIADQLIGVAKKTLQGGVLDMGGVVFTDDGLNAAFGGGVVDARKLEASIKEIATQTESQIEDDQVVFNLNSGSHGGFNLHEITVNVDEEEMDDAFTEMFGDKVTVMLGVNDNQVYVGVGKNPAGTLKKSIDANAGSNENPGIVGQYNIFLTPILDMVAKIETDTPMPQMLRDRMAAAGKDRVRVTYDVVDGQLKCRVEIQDGIFQLFGVAAESMGGMGGGGGADF